ncbi:MAG: hypothetical protein ACOCP4_05800, partial [Candidatus Woesearchaeota archaeon]
NKDEKIDINYIIDKKVRRKNKISKMNLNFEYNTNASVKFDVKDDPTSLPGFVRVVRIRSILQDFFSTSLVKNLKNVEPARPPIIRTNMLTKNKDFRKCLELYDYLSGYKGIGYSYQDSKYNGEMPLNIENKLFDIFVFANFLNEITFNSELLKVIKRLYKNQERKERKEKKIREQEKEKKIRQEEKQKASKKLERKEKSLNKKIKEIEIRKENFKQRYKNMKKKYEKALEKQKKQKQIFVPGYIRKDGVKVESYRRKKPIKKKKKKPKYKIIKVDGYMRKDGIEIPPHKRKIKKSDDKKIKDSKKIEPMKRAKYKFVIVDGYIRKDGVRVSSYSKKVPVDNKKDKTK